MTMESLRLKEAREGRTAWKKWGPYPMNITAINRGPEPAELHIQPTLWFRNDWSSWIAKPGETDAQTDHGTGRREHGCRVASASWRIHTFL